jgi:hypothetical protein
MIDAPVEHGIEGRDLVDPHRRHLKELCDVVHDTDARPPFVLPLSDVEERDDRGLLVLRRIFGDDLLGPLDVVSCECEGYLHGEAFSIWRVSVSNAYLRVVILRVAVLYPPLNSVFS